MDKRFLKDYVFAALITGLTTFLSVIPVIILILPFIMHRKGEGRVKMAYAISLLFAGFATLGFIVGLVILGSANSLSDFEGANGEGVPIAPVIGMLFFALLYLIPWVLASMRGHKAVKIYN